MPGTTEKRKRTTPRKGTWRTSGEAALKTILERIEDLSRDTEDLTALRANLDAVGAVMAIADDADPEPDDG